MFTRAWVIASWMAVGLLAPPTPLHAQQATPTAPAATGKTADSAPDKAAAQKPSEAEKPAEPGKIGAPTGARLISVGQRKRSDMFSFGLHLGQPTGLQVKARLLDLQLLGFNTVHSVVGMVGYDFFYGGLTVHLDYRLDLYTFEFLAQDAEISLWVGGGPRLSILEPYKASKRQLPFSVGGRVTPGVTLALNPIPLELSAYGTILGFDINSPNWPRWRPEFGLEARVRFPYSPNFF